MTAGQRLERRDDPLVADLLERLAEADAKADERGEQILLLHESLAELEAELHAGRTYVATLHAERDELRATVRRLTAPVLAVHTKPAPARHRRCLHVVTTPTDPADRPENRRTS